MLPGNPSSPTPPSYQVAPSRDFKPSLKTKVPMVTEYLEVLKGPGETLNLTTGKRFREVRDQLDRTVPHRGLHYMEDGSVKAFNVPNPDSPDGSWDPLQWMPRITFDNKEDAFPVSPTFDGDLDYNNNGPDTPGGQGAYKDGSIGGNQPLSSAYTVTKKGDYHILTYSMYYAHNKAMDYHKNDYSTVQVYLKPGPDGKLAPTHVATSWHHGSILTPWEDFAKDSDGRPVVKVHLGSHAVQPIGKGDKWDTDGLNITGKGEAVFDGKPIGQKMGFEVFQTNIQGATYMDPARPTSKPRLTAMGWGEAAKNPFLPEVYDQDGHALLVLAKRLLVAGREKVEGVVEDVADKAKDVAADAVDTGKKVLGKIGGALSSL